MSAKKPVFLVTGNDLAAQALALLGDYEIVYAGKTPADDDIVALCKRHDPVAIIVRYGKVGGAAMDAAPSLKVISKHGSGTDTIDKAAAAARGIQVVAAAGAGSPLATLAGVVPVPTSPAALAAMNAFHCSTTPFGLSQCGQCPASANTWLRHFPGATYLQLSAAMRHIRCLSCSPHSTSTGTPILAASFAFFSLISASRKRCL